MSPTPPFRYDWESDETVALLNPRLPESARSRLLRLCDRAELVGHFLLTSSGTTRGDDDLYLIALSKKALLTAAASVNSLIGAGAQDTWCLALPDFHVGGLSIWARAYLSGSRVVSYSGAWNAEDFLRLCVREQISLCSLVPTQLYDLVRIGARAPESLRVVFVGGGFLEQELHNEASALGWPVAVSYGMTETSAQVATSRIGERELRVLSHVEVSSVDGRLCFKGDSLLSGYITDEGFHDPKHDGWFESGDRGEVIESSAGSIIRFHGRIADHVKVSGELVSLHRLDRMLEISRSALSISRKMVVVDLPDVRLGNRIVLVVEGSAIYKDDASSEVRSDFNERVLPFERIHEVIEIPKIPFNELGKLERAKLRGLLAR